MKRPSTALRSHCQLVCHFHNIHSLLQLQGHRVLLHHVLLRHAHLQGHQLDPFYCSLWNGNWKARAVVHITAIMRHCSFNKTCLLALFLVLPASTSKRMVCCSTVRNSAAIINTSERDQIMPVVVNITDVNSPQAT